MAVIAHTELIVGLEIHVELATRSKMFSHAPSPLSASVGPRDHEPNTLIDPHVLGLPGALPTLNERAIELSILVGLALNCRVPERCRWDRKSYFYPDMPKNYQISQYEHPLCIEGHVQMPPLDSRGEPDHSAAMTEGRTIRIRRAHLEEDAGKLLHERPAAWSTAAESRIQNVSLIDFNRAGTPLLEIVTEPDFRSANEAAVFAQSLRRTLRWLGVSDCIMQEGHLRFEPNINMVLSLDNGRVVCTPIVEVKNLNSIRSLRGAIEYEASTQPGRWEAEGLLAGPGTKRTFGWDEVRQCTLPRRGKEDAHDYRYFPDPDLPELHIDRALVDRLRNEIGELPDAAARRCIVSHGLSAGDAVMLMEEPRDRRLFESAYALTVARGVDSRRAARVIANIMLQNCLRRLNEQATEGRSDAVIADLGLKPADLAELAMLRDSGAVNAGGVELVLDRLLKSGAGCGNATGIARELGLLESVDSETLTAWCRQAIEEQPAAARDVRAGKAAAMGRLIGSVMKHARAAGAPSVDGDRVRSALAALLEADP